MEIIIEDKIMRKVAAIQMCSSHLLDQNLQSAALLIEKAAGNGAELVVLPEMFPIIGIKPTDKVDIKESYGEGKIQSFLSEQAEKNNVWIVGGTIPIACDDDNKIRSACIVYNSEGVAVARYDKIHLFDVSVSDTESYKESDTTEPGDSAVVIDTPVGKLGLAVCYDIRFPALFMHLMNHGAEIIAIPSAFTLQTGQAHWEILTRARALDAFCYIIGACQGGAHSSGRQTHGHSLIVNPWGKIENICMESGAGIVYADIDSEYLHKIRLSIPIGKHKKNISKKEL
jgi:nitrilase